MIPAHQPIYRNISLQIQYGYPYLKASNEAMIEICKDHNSHGNTRSQIAQRDLCSTHRFIMR